MRVLINSANLHTGGGVQVAVSLIYELTEVFLQKYSDIEIVLFCSSIVDQNLRNLKIDLSHISEYRVINIYGWRGVLFKNKVLFREFDLCFTVFGPLYFGVGPARHICGFAQPWIAYPENIISRRMPLLKQWISRAKYGLQWLFFRAADCLVVEHEHVRNALQRRYSPRHPSIAVVENCASEVFWKESAWLPIYEIENRESARGQLRLGFVGRGYPHKNLAVLRDVVPILRERFGLDVEVLLTLTDDEMRHAGLCGRPGFRAVGPILLAQCPSFYKLIDAVVFPSVLECFSATPLEAMIMKRPLFVSDLPFMHELCGEFAYYFDPCCANSVANVIYRAFRNESEMSKKVVEAHAYAAGRPTAKDRARRYMDLITRVLDSEESVAAGH